MSHLHFFSGFRSNDHGGFRSQKLRQLSQARARTGIGFWRGLHTACQQRERIEGWRGRRQCEVLGDLLICQMASGHGLLQYRVTAGGIEADEVLKEGAPDYREVGHELARRSGVNLTRARKGVVRLWEARGLALIALVDGNKEEVARIMANANNSRKRGRMAGAHQAPREESDGCG